MDESKSPRREKVVGAATHRTGTHRAAVKPHKVTPSVNVAQVISDYLATLKRGSLTQTYAGATLTKNAALIRTGFAISSQDELYLLTDPTGTGKAGILLSTSGVHLADGRGHTTHATWKEFQSTKVSCQCGTIIIGQSSVSTRDAQALASLLQHIQGKLGK